MIPFMFHFQNKHLYRDIKQVTGFQGLEVGDWEEVGK